MQNKGIYIPSIDAKDIYISSHYDDGTSIGYSLKTKDGHYNLNKFVNTLDYSLDLNALYDAYYKKYKRKDISFRIKRHNYSINVINITFKYSVKNWNQINKNTYVRLGTNPRLVYFDDCIAINGKGEIVAIQLNTSVENPVASLPPYFQIKYENGTAEYVRSSKYFKTIKTNSQLRTALYKDGFNCDGIRYCRFKRSAGSARVGKCLFINEKLFKPMNKFSSKGIKIKEGQDIDLAAYESYLSLTSSSIIDTIKIKPENILLIDDYESVFKESVIETRDKDGRLHTEEKKAEISNSIWDGESLLESSEFGEYGCYGMLLLRNLMFKSCCFNTNIQKWFQDNGITDVSQLNGHTRAKTIEDIKLITTPSSVKYLKFSTFDDWLDNIYEDFGIVKHDKKTHYFGGRMVQTHYQLLNTLQMSRQETEEFLKESLDFAQMLNNKPEVVRSYIKYPNVDEFSGVLNAMQSKNDVVYHMMAVNENFTKTKYYQEFLHDLLHSYYKNLKNGHVYVNGNYSTLLGNPIEMLMQSIGTFNGESQLGVGNIHSKRFEYNQVLLGSRSPHVTIGNIWLPYNTPNEEIDRYFNLTDEIVCINAIGENVLQRLSGADYDSDTVLLTDNQYLIRAAQKNYDVFKTPTSFVSAKKVKRYYTPEQQADLDIKTSVNKIGEIVNLSQELNSLLWDKVYYGASYDDIKDLYYDICQLDVMSGIEIDSAKKEFDINNAKELVYLRSKYEQELMDDHNKKVMPHFFSHIARQKGYYNPKKKNYCKYHTTMDYVNTIVNGFRIKNKYKKDHLPFVAILDNRLFRSSNINHDQISEIYNKVNKYISDRGCLFATETDKEEKQKKYSILYESLLSDVNSEVIGFSTLFRMLSSIEDKENRKIKNVLLPLLFTCENKSFSKAILKSVSTVKQLEYGGEDIFIFGIGYKIAEKSINSVLQST